MKLGVIGKDPIIEDFIIAGRKCLDVEVIAYCDETKEQRDKINKVLEMKQMYETYEDLIHSEFVDTIYVAVPVEEHYDYAEKAMRARKNVIVEKPMVVSSEEAQALLNLSKELNVYLFEGVTNIHFPNYDRIQNNIDSIMPIENMTLSYSVKGYDDLLSLNAYNVHFAVGLFGNPHDVTVKNQVDESTGEKKEVIELHYEGFDCICTADNMSHGESFAKIQGKNGEISLEGAMNTCDVVDIKKGKQHRVFADSEKNRMVYQIIRFQEILRKKDRAASDRLLQKSVDVAKILENTQ